MAAEPATNVVSFREARAKRIKELANQWAENTIDLGKELRSAQETFPLVNVKGGVNRRDGWANWLKTEIGFSEDHASKLIRIAETFDRNSGGTLVATSFKVLEYLSRRHITQEERAEVTERIQGGEKIGLGKAETIVEAIRTNAPKPEEARKIAKETGKPTLARDGNIYLGASKEQEKQSEARREMVFGVRRAIEALAGVGVTPKQFLKQALPHQLWTVDEEHVLDKALDWMSDLKSAWDER